MKDNSERTTINVLLVKAGECAKMIEMEDSLEAMQKLVGGMIEEYMPFEDASDPRVGDCAIVCNEEGKMLGMELNRGIFDRNGRLQDIIAGPFFICYAPVESERFLSMPPDLEEKMRKKFELPEQFYVSENGIRSKKMHPVNHDRKHQMER